MFTDLCKRMTKIVISFKQILNKIFSGVNMISEMVPIVKETLEHLVGKSCQKIRFYLNVDVITTLFN